MAKKKKKIGRPLKGIEAKEHMSCRIEPTAKLMLIKKYGSFQRWIDHAKLEYLKKMSEGE